MDWVSATVRDTTPEALAEQFGGGIQSWVKTRGLNGYSHSLLGLTDFRICFTPGREDLHLIAPGKWLGAVSTDGQRRLLEPLSALSAVFTRIDLQLTDERPVAMPRDVWDALERGDTVSNAKNWFWNEAGGARQGSSVYIGAKSSQQRLVVYDKTAESMGEVLRVRWELRARDDAAETMAAQLLASEDWGNVWAGRVSAFVDFKEAAEGTNSARRPRLPWFEELIAGAAKMRAYPPREPRTLEDVERWLDRQVVPSLAMKFGADGGEIEPLLEMLRAGQQRLQDKHWAMIEASRGRGA